MWESKLPECQKLEAEKLFRGWSPGFDLPSWKGLALPRLILAQEQGESGIPINISSKGHRVFRFFLNPRGFGTGRNQAPPTQQCPPRSHCGPAPPGGLLDRGKSCCFSLVATSLPATTFGTLSGLWSGGVGILSSNLSPSYYTSKNQKRYPSIHNLEETTAHILFPSFLFSNMAHICFIKLGSYCMWSFISYIFLKLYCRYLPMSDNIPKPSF